MENITCAAVTAALEIVQGHQSSAFNPIRLRNGWGDICCLTPASCAVKVTMKGKKEVKKEGVREEGRSDGGIGKKWKRVNHKTI